MAEIVASWGAASSAPTDVVGIAVVIDGGLKTAATKAACREFRLVRRGWDYGGGGECGAVIEDYAPAFWEFSEV